VTPIENIRSIPQYDKEKYKEMILDAAGTVLGFFGFDRTVYSNPKKNSGRMKWYEELKEQTVRDIQTEML
jgi:F420-0:gamma-glutamyl ligase-like protein